MLLRIDHAAVRAEAHLDGEWLLRTDDLTLTGEDLGRRWISFELDRGYAAQSAIRFIDNADPTAVKQAVKEIAEGGSMALGEILATPTLRDESV